MNNCNILVLFFEEDCNILLDLRIFCGIMTCTGEATATDLVNQLIV